MKFIKIFQHLIKFTAAIIFILCAVAISLIVSYYMNFPILNEGGMVGGDIAFHLSWMHVFDRYWPQIPLWFPYSGSGMSVVLGYWVIPYYLALLISHIFPLNIEQGVRIVEFMTVPIVAFELYLFAWLRLKNHIVGLIAAFFYPLSSIATGWISHAGFYSMHTSIVVVLPAFLFYDIYLQYVLEKNSKVVRKRLALLGAGIFIGASLLFHLSGGMSLLLGLPFFTFFRAMLFNGNRLINLIRGIYACVLAVGLGILLSFFLFYPQLHYYKYQQMDFQLVYSAEEYPQLPWMGVLGLEQLKNVGSLFTPLFIARIVGILGIIGIIFGLIKRGTAGSIGLLIIFYLFFISYGKFFFLHTPSGISSIFTSTNLRTVSIVGAFIALIAAYGVWSLVDFPGNILRFLVRKKRNLSTFFIKPLTYLFAGIAAIVLAVYLVYTFRQPYDTVTDDTGNTVEGYTGYGMQGGVVVPLCVVPGWEKVGLPAGKTCSDVAPANLNDIHIGSGGKNAFEIWKLDLEKEGLSQAEGTKVTISPLLGAVMQSFNAQGKAYMINNPSGQTTIALSYYGIQNLAFFTQTSPVEVIEAAKWFGVRYVWLASEADPPGVISLYTKDNWLDAAIIGGTLVKELKDSPGMAVISNKPATLVIGSYEKRAYELVFRNALKGVLPYDKTLLIEGKHNIDDYTIEELKKFHLLILSGYSYKNKSKAWNLLKSYVQEGGNLFIDTGWQYNAKDWSTQRSAGPNNPVYKAVLDEPFPVKETTWGDLGTSIDGFELDENIGSDINLAESSDLMWGDKAWGLAVADVDNLRDWAKPLLYKNNNVIMAYGELGQGKVVWSGMNLFAHVYDKKSPEEYRLVENIFSYFLGKTQIEQRSISFKRPFPDHVELVPGSLSGGKWLYWAEAYTPDWKAYLVDNNSKKPLTIYKAGPSFQAMLLPEMGEGQKILLDYDLSKVFIVSFAVSIFTFLIILITIIDAGLFKRTIENHIKKMLHKHFSSVKSISSQKMKTITQEEEEY